MGWRSLLKCHLFQVAALSVACEKRNILLVLRLIEVKLLAPVTHKASSLVLNVLSGKQSYLSQTVRETSLLRSSRVKSNQLYTIVGNEIAV